MAHRHRFALGVCNCGLRQNGTRLFDDTPRMNKNSRLYCQPCGIMLHTLAEKAEHDKLAHPPKDEAYWQRKAAEGRAALQPTYVPPTTLHAVFEVRNSKRNSYPGKETETVCHIEYVGLCGQLTPGAVLPLLTKKVAAQHKTSDVTFRFWCDTSCATGGSPTYYRLEGSKVVGRE